MAIVGGEWSSCGYAAVGALHTRRRDLTRVKLFALWVEAELGLCPAQKKDSFWAEPHNNNPLEKTTIMRGDPEGAEDITGTDIGEKIKDAVDGVKDKVQEVADKITKE